MSDGIPIEAGPDAAAWAGRRVLITGHTGFKGAWLALWLAELGAHVQGLSASPPTDPSLYAQARVGEVCADEMTADVRDGAAVAQALDRFKPEVVFHMAAQAIVRKSLSDPVGTWATNVVGTANVLQALPDSVKAVVVVTSDKCYRDIETGQPQREDDPLGGKDPYSASKAAQELVVRAHRDSFGGPIATARAGNVFGGGDWAPDRLVPDVIRAGDSEVVLRNPDAVRPWQHVLNPLSGYLRLAEGLLAGDPVAGAFNFGPEPEAERTVREVVTALGARYRIEPDADADKESTTLRLDSTKARSELTWAPLLDFDAGLAATKDWYASGADPRTRTLAQLPPAGGRLRS